MSTKITNKSEVTIDSGHSRTITTAVTHEGCEVYLSSGKLNDHLDMKAMLTWDQMEDVEYLSQVFRLELVCVFAQLVTQLGRIYVNQESYKAIV